MENRQNKLVRLVFMAMLVAISIVLVINIHLPLVPGAAFLEYDPADIPILIGTFAFGPAAGIMLTVVVSLIQGFTVSAQSGPYGILMHIISTGSFVLIAGLIYKYRRTRAGATIGLSVSILATTAIMIGANLVITPLFIGAPVSAVWSMMPGIALFNFLKLLLNASATFILYKPLSSLIYRFSGNPYKKKADCLNEEAG